MDDLNALKGSLILSIVTVLLVKPDWIKPFRLTELATIKILPPTAIALFSSDWVADDTLQLGSPAPPQVPSELAPEPEPGLFSRGFTRLEKAASGCGPRLRVALSGLEINRLPPEVIRNCAD